MIELYKHQQTIVQDVYSAWAAGMQNVLAVLATGGGKTVIFSHIVARYQGSAWVIAHRQELVSQISLALAREGVRHKIIGPSKVIKLCVAEHMRELGRSYYEPNAQVAVAGVKTIISRKEKLASEMERVGLWVMDEAHHIVCENQWGQAVSLFPDRALGLGVTATPGRADGKGLGRLYHGVFDTMVEGKQMSWLIQNGYLTPYVIYAPQNDIDLSTVDVSKATGDYNPHKLHLAIKKSHVVGDVVQTYLRYAKGKLGVTFTDSVETSVAMAESFNGAGVPAAEINGTTPGEERVRLIREFRNGQIHQLVNCDLFGEGFDLPAIETVSFARPTQSFTLYAQQFGRALRTLKGKAHATILDHAGNVVRHCGPPDFPQQWTLADRQKRTKQVSNVKVCPRCTRVFERIKSACPYCGYKPEVAPCSGPEVVDGDLTEMDQETLSRLLQKRAKVDIDKEQYRRNLKYGGLPPVVQNTQVKRHVRAQETQSALRGVIAYWAGWRKSQGFTDSESYRAFKLKYGVDVLTAQSLNIRDAELLIVNILDNP